ncbi:MAG: Hsp20/alpha crystallin family protein [Saprospiraceae bacterium]|jgi:HSP20 family protein|nr:Hsp20/alpha crystallin family protein [Saprospiraceae bacterium]MBP9210285.1 Hsp20/alpha crystallin family protein [Saprospiraceae bacterium]MBV6473802.1 hypothetical protein [Saprospiraceae bacterium]
MSYLSRLNRDFPFLGNLPIWLDDFLGDDGFRSPESTVPAVNVRESLKHFTIEMAAPGMEKSDFKISVDDRVMTVSAERKSETKEEEKGKIKRREYNYTSFSRSFTLPSNIDAAHIGASYDQGILSIHIPKIDQNTTGKAKEISVS